MFTWVIDYAIGTGAKTCINTERILSVRETLYNGNRAFSVECTNGREIIVGEADGADLLEVIEKTHGVFDPSKVPVKVIEEAREPRERSDRNKGKGKK